MLRVERDAGFIISLHGTASQLFLIRHFNWLKHTVPTLFLEDDEDDDMWGGSFTDHFKIFTLPFTFFFTCKTLRGGVRNDEKFWCVMLGCSFLHAPSFLESASKVFSWIPGGWLRTPWIWLLSTTLSVGWNRGTRLSSSRKRCWVFHFRRGLFRGRR
jgi:hypothetical protein